MAEVADLVLVVFLMVVVLMVVVLMVAYQVLMVFPVEADSILDLILVVDYFHVLFDLMVADLYLIMIPMNAHSIQVVILNY